MHILTPELLDKVKTSKQIRFITRNVHDEETIAILKSSYTCEWRHLLQYDHHTYLGIVKFWDKTTDGSLSRIYRHQVEEMELKGIIFHLEDSSYILIRTFDSMQYYKKYNETEILDRLEFYFHSDKIYDDNDFYLEKLFKHDDIEIIKLHEYADTRFNF